MAHIASDEMIDTMSAKMSIKESLRVGLKALRDDMGYENAPRHEKLLIKQVAICWLDVYQVQHRYAATLAGRQFFLVCANIQSALGHACGR